MEKISATKGAVRADLFYGDRKKGTTGYFDQPKCFIIFSTTLTVTKIKQALPKMTVTNHIEWLLILGTILNKYRTQ